MPYLALRNEDSNGSILAGRDGEISDPLNSQLVPDLGEVLALVELDFIGDDARAMTLIGGVLKVPARLRLLDEAAHDYIFIFAGHDLPNLQILHSITIGILGGTLPGDQIGSKRRETQLEDVLRGNGGDNVSDRRINDCHPEI